MSEETLFSAVVVTYNEADLLPGCLESLAFCDELIVVDLGSTDESVAIAHSYGAKVLHHPKDPVVENVRAFGFEHTQHDWIVFLDPDERIHPELVPKIQKIIATNPKVGQIELPWQFYFKGKKLTVTRWGTEDKFKAIVIHKQRTYTRHIVHGGCRPKDGFDLIRVEREGEIYITHYWMRGYRQLIQKHWMYIRKEGESRYVRKRRFSWQKTIQLTQTELIKNLTELGGLRGGWTGIFLSFFWGWYTFMSELSLRNYQKQVEDQPEKNQPEPQKTGLIQKISKWAKALKAYWKLPARRKPKNIPLKDQFGYLREYLGVADQLELRQQPDTLIMHPRLSERTATTSFDRHYFYQDTWAFRHIATQKPALHVDVGSRVIAVGFMSCVTAVEFIDIRPLKAELPNLTCKKGSVLDLPYADQSLDSISCLHVAEHVGLGRYGDSLNVIHGTRMACAELQRVLKPGGKLYFSLPISGENRIEFNAHRVHTVERILSYFPELKLVELSGVTDKGKYVENIKPKLLAKQNYACGFFIFTREEVTQSVEPQVSLEAEPQSISADAKQTTSSTDSITEVISEQSTDSKKFSIFPDDIFLVSYPKSGNTWMRFLLGQVRTLQKLDFSSIDTIIPHIYQEDNPILLDAPRPRVLKSHEQYDGRYPKVIYMVRDPRDIAISFYFWRKSKRFFERKGIHVSLNTYLHQFLDREIADYMSWDSHVSSWLSNQDSLGNNFLLLRYEDIEHSPKAALETVCNFLEWNVDDAAKDFAVQNSTPEEMREAESRVKKNIVVPFVREARSQQWREAFDEQLNAKYWEKFGHLMEKFGYSRE